MKKIFLLSTFIVFSAVVFSQAVDASRQGNSIDQSIPAGNSGQVQSDIPNRVAVNVGVLMGGGSLVGASGGFAGGFTGGAGNAWMNGSMGGTRLNSFTREEIRSCRSLYESYFESMSYIKFPWTQNATYKYPF